MGWLPVPDPVAFSVFGLDIMWYAVMLTAGTAISGIIAYYRVPKHGLSQDTFLDLFLCCAPAGIIGARAYYVLFKWDYYSQHPDQILNTRGGGLAIHGTIIGVVLVLLIFCRIKKEKPLDWLDLVASMIPLGQAIGRWGNYFNSEAHGTATTLPWAIYADGEWVHPTFLYESVWCFLLFLFLVWLSDKKGRAFPGQPSCLYVILYSVERFFVEGLRTDSLMIGPYRQAQVLSAAAFAAGIVLYVILKKRADKASEISI